MVIGDSVKVRSSYWVDTVRGMSIDVRREHGVVVGFIEGLVEIELDRNINSSYIPKFGKRGRCIIIRDYYLSVIQQVIPKSRRRLILYKYIVNNLFSGVDTKKETIYVKNKTNARLPLNTSIVVTGGFKETDNHKVFEVYTVEV